MAGEGSEGAAYQQLAAARVEAINEGTSIRSGELLDFSLAARPGPTTHHMAPRAWSLQTQEVCFPAKSKCTDSLNPDVRTADSPAITLREKMQNGPMYVTPLSY